MKLMGLTGLLLLLAPLLSPAGHWHRAERPLWRQRAPVQIIRSPWAAQAPKTVRRVAR